jgi:protease I
MANEPASQPAHGPSGLRVAFFTTDEGVQQVELTAPRQAITPHDAEHAYYGAVVVRGGVSDGDLLRTASAAVSSLQELLLEADRPAAGQRVLVEADVVRGQTLTSWPSLQTDIENAGGSWVESSRGPNDRSAFLAALTRVFSRRSESA